MDFEKVKAPPAARVGFVRNPAFAEIISAAEANPNEWLKFSFAEKKPTAVASFGTTLKKKAPAIQVKQRGTDLFVLASKQVKAAKA